MRSKLKWIIPIIVMLLIITVFIFPPPQKSFDALAQEVPESQQTLYRGFLNQYRPHRMLVNGASWEYIVAGPEADTILFLHGMTGAYDIWWQQIVALRQEYRLVSVTYPPIANLEELSQGVLRILDSQGIDHTNIVGTSLGGYLAQYLVANHPERVSHVVFSNTFPPNDQIRQDNAAIGAALPFLPEWLIMQTLRGSIADRVVPASGGDPFTRAYLLSIVAGRMTKAQVIARYKTVIESFTPIEPLEHGIAVMIIESDNDPLIDKSLRDQLKETYPLSIQYTFEGAGHFPYLNQPDFYTNLLVKFLTTPIIQ